MKDRTFTPALGHSGLTGLYDRAISALTRETLWRNAVVDALRPADGETIVDIGAGTGSLALLIKKTAPGAHMVAVDPDPEVRKLGEAKARAAGAQIEYVTAMGGDGIALVPDGHADGVTCTLVLHQCPMPAKRAIIANAARLLRPGGRLILGDYGSQPNLLMRLGFLTVQLLDGFEATGQNLRGAIPSLLAECGFLPPQVRAQIRTPTGAITVWRAEKPGS